MSGFDINDPQTQWLFAIFADRAYAYSNSGIAAWALDPSISSNASNAADLIGDQSLPAGWAAVNLISLSG